jgi:hypothetical protein
VGTHPMAKRVMSFLPILCSLSTLISSKGLALVFVLANANLGSMVLLCIISDDEMMICFLKIKFHSNENIKWHCMQLELNPNIIDFNPNSIEKKQDAN